MMDVLDSVQAGKRLQPVNCSSCTHQNIRRSGKPMPNERITARCSWPLRLEMAKWWLGTREDGQGENEVELGEKVDAVERRKDFDASSVSYTTTVLWSVWPLVSLASPGPVYLPPTSRTT
jgi:hypothetical protein